MIRSGPKKTGSLELRNRTQRQGVAEIDKAEWVEQQGYWNLKVHDQNGLQVECHLDQRPHYCDRGHYYVKVDGYLGLDKQDGFPRYFFTKSEALDHMKNFLKWRIWKVRGDVGE